MNNSKISCLYKFGFFYRYPTYFDICRCHFLLHYSKSFINVLLLFLFEELLADKDLTEKIEEITIMAIRNKVKCDLRIFIFFILFL